MKEKTIKDLINDFDLNREVPVIYCFEHLPSGKKYIGSSNNLKRRMTEHFHEFNSGRHRNKHLTNYWKKYPEDFSIEVLEWLGSDDKEYLQSQEKFWIDFYNTSDKKYGFNLIKDPRIGGLTGYKHSEESKLKMSKAIKAFHLTPESKRVKEQSKINLSKADKNKIIEGARERGRKLIGDKNPFYGKKHSDITKKKISKSHKGKYIGEKNPNYGKTHTLENRKIMSDSVKNRNYLTCKRYIVLHGDSKFYIFNLAMFLQHKFDFKSDYRYSISYLKRRFKFDVLWESNQYPCSKIIYNNLYYYEI